jgi:hypothetical protein
VKTREMSDVFIRVESPHVKALIDSSLLRHRGEHRECLMFVELDRGGEFGSCFVQAKSRARRVETLLSSRMMGSLAML